MSPSDEPSARISRRHERPAGAHADDERPAAARQGDERPTGALARERRSFGYAFAGLGHAWRTQPHLRVHAALGLLALALAWALALTPPEWATVLAMITLVLALEMLNTAVEAAVDLASPEQHPLAKVAKDVTAGAVLVAAIGSVAVAAVLFLPRLVAVATAR